MRQSRSDFFKSIPDVPPQRGILSLSTAPAIPATNVDTPTPETLNMPPALKPTKPEPLILKQWFHKIASIDMAADLLAGDKLPRQEEQQIKILTRAIADDTNRMVSIRRMHLERTKIQDDDTLAALHSILEPVLDVKAPMNVRTDAPASAIEEAFETLERLTQAGIAKPLYTDYPDIGTWIEGCVTRLCDKLNLSEDFPPATGRTLFKALVHLRCAYGDLLAGMTPLFEGNPNGDQFSVSFANRVIPEIRYSMMAATIRRFQQDPKLQHAIPDLYRIIESGKDYRPLPKLSSRSDFNDLRRIFDNTFDGSTWQLYSPTRALHDFDIFCKLAVPYLDKCGSNFLEEAASPNVEWFLPGQIAVAHVAQDSTERTICTSFDSHIDVTSVAVALKPSDGYDTARDYYMPLGGLGLHEELQFHPECSVIMRIGPTGKLYSSYANRFVKDDGGEQSTALHASVEKFIKNQQATLLALENRAPDILKIVNESDPTIVVIDGSRVFVLGTCVEPNEWRRKFFNPQSSEMATELAKRCGLDLYEPERWYVQELSLESISGDEVVDEESEDMPLEIKEARKVLRETLSREGNMPFRDFARSLRTFGVIETTSGNGSHCSLERCLNGTWLRAGSWYHMRKESHLKIKRIFEILANLKIPLTEYAESLTK